MACTQMPAFWVTFLTSNMVKIMSGGSFGTWIWNNILRSCRFHPVSRTDGWSHGAHMNLRWKSFPLYDYVLVSWYQIVYFQHQFVYWEFEMLHISSQAALSWPLETWEYAAGWSLEQSDRFVRSLLQCCWCWPFLHLSRTLLGHLAKRRRSYKAG